MKHRILAAVTAAALTIPTVCAPVISYGLTGTLTASAAEDKETVKEGDLTFLVYSDHAEVTKCADGAKGHIDIPEEVNGVPVTVIAASAFSNTYVDINGDTHRSLADLTGVTIPDSVTTIQNRAFLNCNATTEIAGGNGVTAVADDAFIGCGWFNDAKLNGKTLILGHVLITPGGIIGKYIIPEGVTSVYDEAFSLEGQTYTDDQGSITLRNVSISSDLFYIKVSAVVLPEGFERVEGAAFKDISAPVGTPVNVGSSKRVGSIYMPASVNYIDVSVLSKVKEIWYAGTEEEWENIEKNDTLPEDIDIQYNVSEVPASADIAVPGFDRKGLTANEVHTYSEDGTFWYSVFSDHAVIGGLTDKDISGKIVIPAEADGKPVTSIYYDAFKSARITDVSGGENIRYIDRGVFEETPFLEELHNRFTECVIGKVLVYTGGIMGRYTVPDGVVSAYSGAFSSKTSSFYPVISFSIIDSLVFPEGFEAIDDIDISLTHLKEVYIPRSVTYVTNRLFDRVQTVWYEGTEEEWNALVGTAEIPASVTVNLGAEKMPEPERDSEGGVMLNSAHSFSTDGTLDYAVYHDQATVIGLADKEYSGALVIPDEIDGKPVTWIYSEAFRDSGITSVELPDTLIRINSLAFEGCSELTEVKGGENVSELESGTYPSSVFSDTPWLEEAVRSEKPLVLGNLLVYAGTQTGDYVVPENITAIDRDAFTSFMINGPDSVSLPEGLKVIPDSLLNSSRARQIYIPVSVEFIGRMAFSFSTNEKLGVKDIWYGGTEEQWDAVVKNTVIPEYVTIHYGAEGIEKTVEPAVASGDANCDGKVNVADAVAVLQFIANQNKYPLTGDGARNADCDGSSGITGMDAVAIQKIDAGII